MRILVNKSVLHWQLFLGGMMLWCAVSPLSSFLFKCVIDIFASGRSDFKLYFFLTYLLVILSFRHLPATKSRPYLACFNWLLAATLFVFGLSEFWVFNDQFFDDPTGLVYPLHHAAISSTSIYHIHNAKLVLAFIQSLFSTTHNEWGYDSGYPYLLFYPTWWMALHSLVYIVFFISSLIQLRSYRALSPGLYAVFVLVSFMVLRNVLDGGLLFAETLAAVPAYTALQWQLWRRQRFTSFHRYVTYVFAALSIAAALCFMWIADLHPQWIRYDNPLHYVVLIVFLWTVYVVWEYAYTNRYCASIAGLAFLAFFIGLSTINIYTSWGSRQFTYATQKIDQHFTVAIPTKDAERITAKKQILLEILSTEPIGKMTLINAAARYPVYLWQLAGLLKVKIIYGDIDVHDVSCTASDNYKTDGSIYVLEARQLPLPTQKEYGELILRLKKMSDQTMVKPPEYIFEITAPGCSTNRDNLVKYMLDDIGIISAVVKVNEHQKK
ncbi:MAG: hypothetical protein SFT92_03280 [Rickettsiales bacterium]|nr:hypothetical protein [Rickettsiales bacterium]